MYPYREGHRTVSPTELHPAPSGFKGFKVRFGSGSFFFGGWSCVVDAFYAPNMHLCVHSYRYSRFTDAFVAHGWEDQADLLYTQVSYMT